jgi:hypothetical protein
MAADGKERVAARTTSPRRATRAGVALAPGAGGHVDVLADGAGA